MYPAPIPNCRNKIEEKYATRWCEILVTRGVPPGKTEKHLGIHTFSKIFFSIQHIEIEQK